MGVPSHLETEGDTVFEKLFSLEYQTMDKVNKTQEFRINTTVSVET
jgi:hypothetical protein